MENKNERKQKKKYIIFRFVLSYIVLFFIFWVRIYFDALSVEQLAFNFIVTIEGASNEVFVIFLRDLLIFLIPFFILIFILFRKPLKNEPHLLVKIFNKEINIFPMSTKFLRILSYVILILSIVLLLKSVKLYEFIKNNSEFSGIYEKYYVEPDSVKLKFPEKKRNLIYVVLESMETSYSNYEIGGNNKNLIPNLKNIALNNRYFSNTNDFGGALSVPFTTWTASSVVAQTSAVPLNLPLEGKIYETDESYLKYVTSIGDILQKEGYNQVFMMGSDSTFGGKKAYLKEHGDYKILDYNMILEEGKIPENYMVRWGFEDSKLFEFAKEEILNLASKEEPFNFTMLTANTHFFEGYLEEDCKKEYKSRYANSIKCSDAQIYKFINWIKKQDFYTDTTIVLIGDHITMNELFFFNHGKQERFVYNAFINSSVDAQNYYNRQFSVIDMFPTTLASIGVDVEGNKLGLGTNLFSNEQTLIEKLGKEYFIREIQKKSKYYQDRFIYGNESVLTN